MADVAWLNPMIHATASDWAARVVVNGGAAVSDNTLYAVSNFCGALDSAAITNLMVTANVFAPDNLIASITPLYKVYGNDPWTNNNFVSSDLSVQGLKGNASNKYLDTGFIATSAFTTAEGGISAYNTLPDLGNGQDMETVVGSNGYGLQFNAANVSTFFNWATTGSGIITGTSLPYGLGFLSGNREDTTHMSLYSANSIVPFSSIGFQGSTNAGAVSTVSMPIFARNSSGVVSTYSAKRISFAAFHHGLTSSGAQSLFNAVQALRVALGGGWV